jgi:hypothetical protein
MTVNDEREMEFERIRRKMRKKEPLTESEQTFASNFIAHDPVYQQLLAAILAAGDVHVGCDGELVLDVYAEERMAAGLCWE